MEKLLLNEKAQLDRFGKEIGVNIICAHDGYSKVELEIEDRHMNPGNSVHGGCLFTLADIVGGWAAWSRGNYVVTCSSNINYLNPAINIKKLIAVGKEIKYGKKIAVYEVDIFDENNKIIAKATNTYYNMGHKLDL